MKWFQLVTPVAVWHSRIRSPCRSCCKSPPYRIPLSSNRPLVGSEGRVQFQSGVQLCSLGGCWVAVVCYSDILIVLRLCNQGVLFTPRFHSFWPSAAAWQAVKSTLKYFHVKRLIWPSFWQLPVSYPEGNCLIISWIRVLANQSNAKSSIYSPPSSVLDAVNSCGRSLALYLVKAELSSPAAR